MNTYYIYAYIRHNGTPYYIGKGTKRRAWDKNHAVRLPDLDRIIIMESGLSEIGAYALERRYIRWWGRCDLGTGILRNLSEGGEGRSVLSDEARRKLSISAKNRRPYSENHSKMMSEMLRQRWSDPVFQAMMSAKRKGRKKSEDHCRKIGESQKGKVISDDAKKKQSETMKKLYANGHDSNKGMLGRKLTDEQKEKCRQVMLKRWAKAKQGANSIDSQ